MKPSGSPETGDLVRLKKGKVQERYIENYKNWWHTGLIIDCRGIECYLCCNREKRKVSSKDGNAGPQGHSWWPRNKLEVINESR